MRTCSSAFCVLLLCSILWQRQVSSEEPEDANFNSIQDKNGRYLCTDPIQFKNETTPCTLWTIRFVKDKIFVGPNKSGKLLSFNQETKEIELRSSDDPNAAYLAVKVTVGKARPYRGFRAVIMVEGNDSLQLKANKEGKIELGEKGDQLEFDRYSP